MKAEQAVGAALPELAWCLSGFLGPGSTFSQRTDRQIGELPEEQVKATLVSVKISCWLHRCYFSYLFNPTG